MTVPLLIRRVETEKERNFVHSAWKHSYARFRPTRLWWDENGHVTRYVQMPSGHYYTQMGAYIDGLFRGDYIRVAVATDQPGLVLGFIAFEGCFGGPKLHYVYVAKPFRRFGIARQMCVEVIGDLTPTIVNWTPVVEHIKLPSGWGYNEVRKWH